MNKFSEKSLQALGNYYVYGLIDPRDNRIFYIGKGTKNRVFEHEREYSNNPNSEKLKLKTISKIKAAGHEVKKIIINFNLSEEEAFATEASLINILNYSNPDQLTNIVAGHYSVGALSVEDFEKKYEVEELEEKDIKHNILVVKINKLYKQGMSQKDLYDAVRGIWNVSEERVKKVQYVFGVYHSLIVAVYKPTKWFVYGEAKDKMIRKDIKSIPKNNNKRFFIDERYFDEDKNEQFYKGKSIAKLKKNKYAQNPVLYLEPNSNK